MKIVSLTARKTKNNLAIPQKEKNANKAKVA